MLCAFHQVGNRLRRGNCNLIICLDRIICTCSTMLELTGMHILSAFCFPYLKACTSLLVAKSSTFATMEISTKILQQITNEFGLMKSLFDEWGISQAELDREQETSATTAYGAFIIDAGFRGDETSLLVAVAACLLGYGEVGLWLVKESTRNGSGIYIEGNKYSR